MRLSVSNGPYWTSNINCNGTENRLADCEKTELGMVTKCESRHYAGVICYDREGRYQLIELHHKKTCLWGFATR